MPIIESVMGIQVIGNNGENIIKSPIVEAYIGSSLLDSTEVASDAPTDISTKVEQLMAAKHSHSNKAVLDKFAEGSDGKPTYNGIAVGGGSGGGGASTASEVSYTNESLEGAQNVKTALDAIVENSHTHANKDTLDKLSDANGKLQYNGSDISVTKANVITALGYTPKAISTKVATGTNITLADNTEYRLTDVTTLTLTYPTGKFECWMRLTFAASGNITVTLPADTEYLGATPNFKNGETWELSFKDKVLAAKKVGADDKDAGGENGVTPHIGENGNWYIGNTDTGKPSRGADGKSAYQYAQEGGYTGTETEFSEKLASGMMLVEITENNGTLSADKTYLEIADAILAGTPVFVHYDGSSLPLIEIQGDNLHFGTTTCLNDGIDMLVYSYVVEITTNGEVNSIIDTLETLPNPNAITFTGAVTGSYDGSAAMTVNIPSAVTDDHINSLIDAKLGVIENGSY